MFETVPASPADPRIDVETKARNYGWPDDVLSTALKMADAGKTSRAISEEIGKEEAEVRHVVGCIFLKPKSWEDSYARLRELQAEGKGPKECSQILNEEGYRTKMGKPFSESNTWVLMKKMKSPEVQEKKVTEKKTPDKKKDPEEFYERITQLYSTVEAELSKMISRKEEAKNTIQNMNREMGKREKLLAALEPFMGSGDPQ